MRLTKYIIYGIAFLFSILVTGFFLSFLHVSTLMIPRPPRELAALASKPAQAPGLHPGRLKAAVILSRSGVQITDLMAPYEILATSGSFDVFTVARDTNLVPTTGGVSVLPDYRFDQAPPADLLVIPAELDPGEPELQAFVRGRAPKARLILAVCEGARVLAQAGLLNGRKATTHRMALSSLEKSAPRVHWESVPRWVEDHGIITSAGVTASIDATLVALSRMAGPEAARSTASELGYPASFPASEVDARPRAFSDWDFFRWLARGGFDWGRPHLGVLTYPGISELSLAATLDTFMRAQGYAVTPLSLDKSRLIRTRHGMLVDVREGLPADGSPQSQDLDTVVVPSGEPGEVLQRNAPWQNWFAAHGSDIVDLERGKPAQAFEQAFALLSERQGAGNASLVARLVEYPGAIPPSSAPDYPLRLWIRALLVGFLAVFLVWMARVRFTKT